MSSVTCGISRCQHLCYAQSDGVQREPCTVVRIPCPVLDHLKIVIGVLMPGEIFYHPHRLVERIVLIVVGRRSDNFVILAQYPAVDRSKGSLFQAFL